MSADAISKGRSLFLACRAVEDSWKEIENLVGLLDKKLDEETKRVEWRSSRSSASDQEANEPKWTCWSYQFGFKLSKRARGQSHIGYLDYEFRLCWSDEKRIASSNGESFSSSLILAKFTTVAEGEFECFGMLCDPETEMEKLDYEICNRLLVGNGGRHVAYAVPLYAIENENAINNELVLPMMKLAGCDNLMLSTLQPRELEIMASSRAALSWKNEKGRIVTLRNAKELGP